MSRAATLVVTATLIAGLLFVTCVVPYWFPPSHFVVGASYEVGFNNAVAFWGYALFVPLLAMAVARRLAPGTRRVELPSRWHVSRTSHVLAALILLAHLALFVALYLFKGRFVFAESLYFQSLLYRMSSGDIPYADFSFYYGPLMLYPAHWLSALVGLDAGYAIWFIATYLVGLVFLYVAVSFVAPTAPATATWFAGLALGLFNPLTGLNVTFTRYLLPTMVFLAASAFFGAGGFRRGLIATLALAASLAYSFEVAALGLAAVVLLAVFAAGDARLWRAVGTIVRLAVGGDAGTGDAGTSAAGKITMPQPGPPAATVAARALALCGGAAILAAALFLATDPTGHSLSQYPAIALSYSGGAHNVPIYPHLPFLALAGLSVITFAVVLRAAADGRLAPAVAVYAALAFVAQRAAFAAAEPSHFAYFGLPLFLLAVLTWPAAPALRSFAGYAPSGPQLALAGVLLVGIALPMQYYHLTEFMPFLQRRAGALAAEGNAATLAPPQPTLPREEIQAELRSLVRTVGADRPYVMYEMEYDSLPVYRDFHLRYALYSTMLITARDRAGVDEAIDDVRKHHAVIVARPQDLQYLAQSRRSTGIWRWLDRLSGAHTGGSSLSALLLQSKNRLFAPFVAFARSECTPVYKSAGLVALVPR